MIRKFKTAIILVVLSMILSSCSQSVQTSSPKNPDEIIESSDEKSDEIQLSEEEKAKEELEIKKAEREALEKKRKDEKGEFYVPLIPIGMEREKRKVEVKALYATGHTAGNELNKANIDAYGAYVKALSDNDAGKTKELLAAADKANKFERIIGIAVGSEINAIVINVKDDNGFITYNSNVDIVKSMNASTAIQIKDINNVLKVLKEYDIYTIGRIVTFKDKHFAMAHPEHAIQLKTGGTWLDPNSGKIPWVNPFDKYVWDYNIAIAKEAALIGFDEIQFDYVRFPDGAKKYNPITEFPGREGRDKDEAIGDFLKYAGEELKPYSVNIGADVFGLITRTWDDYPEDIGQNWLIIGENVDSICPMIYPSHYSKGWYNLDDPNAYPYLVVKGALEEAQEKNSAMEKPPVIRSWIQDFDWAGKKYGPKELRDQVIAAKELGLNEYMVWNPSNNYNPYSFIESETEKNKVYPLDKGELDFREKSPADAADKYLNGKLNSLYSHMYLMTPIKDREQDFEIFRTKDENAGIKLSSYKVLGYSIDKNDKNSATVSIRYKYQITKDGATQVIEKDNVTWNAVKERGIWKVKAEF